MGTVAAEQKLAQFGLACQAERQRFEAAFRSRLRRLTVQLGSQSELARRSGVSQRAISNCLSGRNLPNTDTAARIARAGGRDLTWLYGLDADQLAAALETVESVLAELGLRLAPRAKAATVVLVYGWLDQDQKISRPRLVRLLRAAA